MPPWNPTKTSPEALRSRHHLRQLLTDDRREVPVAGKAHIGDLVALSLASLLDVLFRKLR